MKNKNRKSGKLVVEKACSTAAKIRDFKIEIEYEELHSGDKFDWRVASVGDVGSDSWDANMQEIELELERLRTQHANKTRSQELQRITQLAGIAKPKVEALALKQMKRQTKKF